MPNQTRNNSGNNTSRRSNEEQRHQESSSGGWLLPAVVGAALGAAATYFIAKEVQQSECGGQRFSRGTSSGNYSAPPCGCCSICQDDYQATVTLSCGHVLHRTCYDALVANRDRRCPVCREVYIPQK